MPRGEPNGARRVNGQRYQLAHVGQPGGDRSHLLEVIEQQAGRVPAAVERARRAPLRAARPRYVDADRT